MPRCATATWPMTCNSTNGRCIWWMPFPTLPKVPWHGTRTIFRAFTALCPSRSISTMARTRSRAGHEDVDRLKSSFSYHPPKDDQPARYTAIRDHAHDLAKFILENAPRSREQSLALTKLEEAAMWANAARAKGEW